MLGGPVANLPNGSVARGGDMQPGKLPPPAQVIQPQHVLQPGQQAPAGPHCHPKTPRAFMVTPAQPAQYVVALPAGNTDLVAWCSMSTMPQHVQGHGCSSPNITGEWGSHATPFLLDGRKPGVHEYPRHG
jgi:hypothetical protein